MQVEIFTLCDAATAEGGKLNVLGAFDTIWAKAIPAVHPQCALAMRLRFDRFEGNVHDILVHFIDFDGKHVLEPVSGKINVAFDEGQESSSALLVLNIHMLKIERYGIYSLNLQINGRQAAAIPLFIRNPAA